VADGGLAAPQLVLGPLLRYAGETEVTIWVETDRACLVEILGRQARTFQVAGHHYGLVVIDGLSGCVINRVMMPWRRGAGS
jgi:hypothetical protein